MIAKADSSTTVTWSLTRPDGHVFPLAFTDGGSSFVGRDPTCEVCLLDAGVSRQHAVLYLENGQLHVDDLHSQNGTFVNSAEVRSSRLDEGDFLTIGGVHLRVAREEREPPSHAYLASQPTCAKDELLEIARVLTSARPANRRLRDALLATAEVIGADRALAALWRPDLETADVLVESTPQVHSSPTSRETGVDARAGRKLPRASDPLSPTVTQDLFAARGAIRLSAAGTSIGVAISTAESRLGVLIFALNELPPRGGRASAPRGASPERESHAPRRANAFTSIELSFLSALAPFFESTLLACREALGLVPRRSPGEASPDGNEARPIQRLHTTRTQVFFREDE